MSPIPLGVYRHYKGDEYEVIGFAKHSETLEDMVVYKALYGERGTWVRPLSMWENPIEIDGKIMKRFEYAGKIKAADSQNDLAESRRSLLSMLQKCEKIDTAKLGKSQQTLLERRIAALKVAISLIDPERHPCHSGGRRCGRASRAWCGVRCNHRRGHDLRYGNAV